MSLFMKRGAGLMYPPRIACFVCGTEGPADYTLFMDHTGDPQVPHFPFFLLHPPPMGCLPMEPGKIEVKSCRTCLKSLHRQWEEYARQGIPVTKRTYWIKRQDGVPFLSVEAQITAIAQLYQQHHHPNHLQQPQHHHHPVPRPHPHHHHLPQVATAASTSAMPAPMEPPAGVDRSKVTSTPLLGHSGNSGPASSQGWAPPSGHHNPPVGAPRNTTASSRTVTSTESNVTLERPSLVPPNSSDNDSALDLSSGSRERDTVKSHSSVASHVSANSHISSSYVSEGAGSSSTSTALATDTLDLTLPDKNASWEVCYVCGDEFKKGTLSFTFAKQVNKEPFYPSLMIHPRPPKSSPIDSSGRVHTCDECHDHLYQQWVQFEADEILHPDRNYKLRKRPMPLDDNATFVCYICALEYHSSSVRLLYAKPNIEKEPYYPFIEQLKPQPGASPISPQGMVQVCCVCHDNTKEKHHGFVKENQPPPKKRRGNSFSIAESSHDAGEDEERQLPYDVTCILCRRKFDVGSFKSLHTQGPPSGGLPFFPFLSELSRPDEMPDSAEEDRQKRVRACQTCATSLINQWTQFQRDSLPVEERNYQYPSLVTGPRSINSVRAHSPASLSQRSGGAVTPSKSSTAAAAPSAIAQAVAAALPLDAPGSSSSGIQPRTRSNTLESRPRSTSNPHSPNPASRAQQQVQQPAPSHSPSFSVHSARSSTAAAAAASSQQQQEAANTAAAASSSVPLTSSAAASAAASAVVVSSSSSSAATPIANSLATAVTAAASTTASSSSAPPAAKSSSNAPSFFCFLCGLHSDLSFSRMLYSTARARGSKAPFFPFMKTHKPKNKAETLREDGTALVCTFCYHSIMVQWTKHNEARPSVDPRMRKYNFHDYICYVCGITTYRKRIRALSVPVRLHIKHMPE